LGYNTYTFEICCPRNFSLNPSPEKKPLSPTNLDFMRIAILLLLLLLMGTRTLAFLVAPHCRSLYLSKCLAAKGTLFDKILFNAAELLGVAIGEKEDLQDHVLTPSKQTKEEVLASLTELFVENYFVNGGNNESTNFVVFASNCVFMDEFSRFSGTGKFRRNCNNFANVLLDDSIKTTLKSLKIGKENPTRIEAEWLFTSVVKMLNRRLSARGITTYTLDSSNQIIEHDERWITKKTVVLTNLFFGKEVESSC